mgnify:CR=1 FL=1
MGRELEHKNAAGFMLELNRPTAPWAFSKGEPFRTVASLEHLGTLISIMAL